ncbi:hypothetical protein [Trichocoleus sp. FACHB-69]|uniref:hypothetical protein n=1 Tax=Trichocoleus sp. FACHB-69 TaxID=2692874 RepID=UPI0028C48FCB|nr:hypothetical protein [Trichocoleus sp. FACHB-69]
MIDHDRLFKELLTEFFTEFLELFFPEIVGYLEPNSISFEPNEIILMSRLGQNMKLIY